MKPETLALHHGYAPDDQHAVAVPIEHVDDILADLEQALAASQT